MTDESLELNGDEEDEESHGYADFTAEELLEQAQLNAQATIMATALFLHRKGIAVEEWGQFLGETFALAWDDNRNWEAGEFLDAVLTNMRSLGAKVISAQLGIDKAEAVVTGFPDAALSELFSIDQALSGRYNEAARTLATKCGFVLEWRRSRDRTFYNVRVADT